MSIGVYRNFVSQSRLLAVSMWARYLPLKILNIFIGKKDTTRSWWGSNGMIHVKLFME